ncbi:MAG: efflux RND transporter periplasmic adaptor subunit [Vicinamibacterales bacterium]
MKRATVVQLLVGGCVGLMACTGQPRAKAAEADKRVRDIAVEPVTREDVRRDIEAVGTLMAEEEVTLSAESEGKVSRILADLGDRVQVGQVLVELDREKLQYKLDEQRAALDRARARYGVRAQSTTLPPVESTPDVQKAQAELAQAEQAFKRAEELNRRSLLPHQQLEDAEARHQTAKAAYASALQNARNLSADIDASEANVKLAERELRDATIRAPFDAYVQKRLVSPGQFLRLQTPVMSLVKVDPLKLVAEVPERLAPWVKVGQTVSVRVDAYPDSAIDGKVVRISPGVTQQTRAFPFEAEIANREGRLKPGGFARVRIDSDRVDTVLTLPAAALQYRYGVNRVFKLDGDHLTVKEVKIGDRLGDRVEILEGVDAGDRVAVTDIDRLNDGQKVQVGASRDVSTSAAEPTGPPHASDPPHPSGPPRPADARPSSTR